MKHAILITAYKNFEHLKDLAEFFDQNFEIFIHIDKKSNLEPKVLNELQDLIQVKLVSRKYKVNWGGVNHLKCILYLAKEALKNKNIERFHVISGHDYPIKTCSYFVDYFKRHSSENYLNFHELPSIKWPNGGLDRIEYYNFYDLLNAKRYRHYIFKLVEIQKKLKIKRRISKKVPKLYGGETWWSLSREALSYVIDFTDKNKFLLNRFKHSFCSEEMYVHTVLLNSKFAATVVNDSLRYIDWSDRNGNFPANLDNSDLEKMIISKNKFFARKFEFPISLKLKLSLIKYLDNIKK
ncbi:beta-1,6-N-acetylglucosaminyltransferase [Hanstruepera marina]|uniref:beta-1,6-N-acetylglucosaminyltransferase n=1 Tax=Hanstruepera marina TaxID=2873265 RepID=UPI001CA75DE0|nr:beta-1,6-N-acetylglucosaminyltransferase [Hanstruepera marina]